ncbi:MAG: hypothetical protein LBN24_12885 [Mediterranea sp.]|jgi:hypothetical protein|nr:hypothetical protein [Mediterranea sp.]
MMKQVHILVVRFRNELRFASIPRFRGAVNAMLQSHDLLFHNHTPTGFRYSYPLIQYKRMNGRAALVCLEEGAESIGDFFAHIRQPVAYGEGDPAPLELESVQADKVLVQVWDTSFAYSLRKWIPLNSENYARYQGLESLKERIEFLERILTGNILSFAKGLGIEIEQELRCSITDLTPLSPLIYKGIKFAAFDVAFRSNISLPGYIGLGKGVSHGFGTVVRVGAQKKEQKENEKNES